MMHVRVAHNPLRILEPAQPLPITFQNIAGFHRLPPDELRRFGWYPFEADPEPAHDPRAQRVTKELTLGEDGVVRLKAHVISLGEHELGLALAEQRRITLARLAQIRWERETAGIEWRGLKLHTDRESQATIALAAMEGEPARWKCADGRWHELSAEELVEAARAVKQHRRACFANEEVLAQALRDALSLNELEIVDLEEGWP